MASTVTILVTARSTAASTFASVRAASSRMATSVRADVSRMSSGFSSLTSRMFATSRAVSSVAGAYRDANGLWRNANGTLVMQRNHVTHTTTAYGRLVGAMRTAGRAGSALGTAVMEGLSSTVDAFPGKLKGILIAGLAGLGLALAPVIGAALNGALLAALGGGVLAIGITNAVKDAGVAGAFKGLFSGVSADVKSASQSMVEPLEFAARRFKLAWQGAVGSGVTQALVSLAAAIKPIANGLAGMAEKAMPGFNRAIQAAVPVLQQLGAELPGLGQNLSDFFRMLSLGGGGAVKGIMVLVRILGSTLKQFGAIIMVLSVMFDLLTRKAEAVFTTLSKAPVIGGMFKGIAASLREFNAEAADSDAVEGYGFMLDDAGAAAGRTGSELSRLNEQMNKLYGTMTTTLDANIAWEEAWDRLTESVKENGRNLDITTDKGRQNTRAIEDSARAAWAKREADIAAAGGQNASKEAVDAANAAFARQIGELEGLLRKLGFTEEQISQVLGQWRGLAAAPDIHKTVTVERKVLGPALGPQYGYRGFASGTPSAPPGMAWVGEEGPELMSMRGGERIYSARQSEKMAAGAGGGGGQVVQVVVSGGSGATSLSDLVLGEIRAGRIKLTVRSGRVAVA